MHLSTKDLPDTLRAALRALGYARPDVSVEPAVSYCPFDAGEQGRRGFACAVNLTTGERAHRQGSWGGANMFNPRNAIDLDTQDHPLPPGFAIILGSDGYAGCYASILVHPSSIAQMLPAPAAALPDFDAIVWADFNRYTGPGRRDEWARRAGDDPDWTDATVNAAIERLCALGYLKSNRAGACQITTSGKNADTRADWRNPRYRRTA